MVRDGGEMRQGAREMAESAILLRDSGAWDLDLWPKVVRSDQVHFPHIRHHHFQAMTILSF